MVYDFDICILDYIDGLKLNLISIRTEYINTCMNCNNHDLLMIEIFYKTGRRRKRNKEEAVIHQPNCPQEI